MDWVHAPARATRCRTPPYRSAKEAYILGAKAQIGLQTRAALALVASALVLAAFGAAAFAQTTSESPTITNVAIVSGASTPPSCYTNSSCGSNYLYGYGPTAVTVVIGVNNTVTWTNDDTGVAHTVTSSAGDPASFSSGCIGSGCSPATPQTFTYTFTVAGTYYYHCTYHGWMEGEVMVEAPSASGTTSVTGTTTSTTTSGIPEFPFQPLAIGVLAVAIVLAYVAMRRPTSVRQTGAPRSVDESPEHSPP